MKRIFTKLLLPVLVALSLLAPQFVPASTQADPIIQSLIGKVLSLTAPVGGVVAGSPYVIQNYFVVALESKSAGQSFNAIFKDAVVTLPYYQGTVYKGQHAHWYTTTGKVTDYEGREIGFFVEDCTPTDTTCDVHLTGNIFDPSFRSCTPLINSLPQEVLVTMSGGNGTGAFTIAEYADSFEIDMTTDGAWGNNGTITLTVTKPGVASNEVWAAMARGIPPRIQREIQITAGTNQLIIRSVNTSGNPIPAGSRITTGLAWRVAKREE